MKKYEITKKDINTLFEKTDCVDYCEGVLLDNYVFYNDNYTAFVFEEYINTWSSRNVAYIIPNAHIVIIREMWERFNGLLQAF